MSAESGLWFALAGLVVTAMASLGAKSLRHFSRHRLEEIASLHKAPDVFGEILRRHQRAALAAECLQTIAAALTVAAALYYVWQWPIDGERPGLLILATVAAALAVLAAGNWLAWAIVHLWAEPFLFRTWPFWKLIEWLMLPLTLGARFVDALFHRLAGRQRSVPTEESFEEEIRSIVSEGHREGLLEEDAREMIEGVIELSDADVSHIMTPRTDMVSIHVGLSVDEATRFAIRARHSRIPVYDKSRDDVVGVLYTRDLLPELAKPPEQRRASLRDIMRKPHFVPETKPVDALLEEFQLTRNHMAIVLDEYGGVSGLVTIEDVLEEIVGEIVDEYDVELVEGIRPIDEKTCEALARVHVDEINERLGIELPDDGDFDTIGGFVFSQLGHVPTVDETVTWNNVQITVLDATPRRIERVRIEILDEPEQVAADV